MPQVNFYLKKPETTGLSLIYLQIKYSGQRVVFSFNQRIKPGSWSNKRQRVKSNTQTTADGGEYLNDYLDSLEKVCLRSYNSQLKDGLPDPDKIKHALTDFTTGAGKRTGPTLLTLIDRFIAGEILHKGKKKTAGTRKAYNLTKNRLLEFSRAKKYPIDFDTITLDFYYKFVSYLQNKTRIDESIREPMRLISDSSIGNAIKDIKTFMREAWELGYTKNIEFQKKKFAKLTETTDAVYLTWDEILKLYRHDFSGQPTLEAVRDLFVFGCCVGLRYSDYSTIKPENIIKEAGESFIKVNTQKTGDLVIIPCHPLVLQIFRKYKDRPNSLPRTISGQKFNQYIKDACKGSGLTETGRLITDPDLELWECISSHTARRSMATNYYLEGFPVIDLMKITGHKTEKSFLTYIKVSKLDTAKRLSAHIKKNWSEKLLRVAG